MTPNQVLQIPEWIRSILSNDESSSDEELVQHIVSQEKYLDIEKVEDWVFHRDFFLNNIVMTDGEVYKPIQKI